MTTVTAECLARSTGFFTSSVADRGRKFANGSGGAGSSHLGRNWHFCVRLYPNRVFRSFALYLSHFLSIFTCRFWNFISLSLSKIARAGVLWLFRHLKNYQLCDNPARSPHKYKWYCLNYGVKKHVSDYCCFCWTTAVNYEMSGERITRIYFPNAELCLIQQIKRL